RGARVSDVDNGEVGQCLQSPSSRGDDPVRHVFLAARETAVFQESAHVALVAIVRALSAARCRRDIAHLHVAVGEGTLEVVEESFLKLSSDAVGVVDMNVGEVNYLLESAREKRSVTDGM